MSYRKFLRYLRWKSKRRLDTASYSTKDWTLLEDDEFKQIGVTLMKSPAMIPHKMPYERVDCTIRGIPTIYYIEINCKQYQLWVKRGKHPANMIFSSGEPFGIMPQKGSEMPRIVPFLDGEVTITHLHTAMCFLQDGQIPIKYNDHVKIRPQVFTGKEILVELQRFTESDLLRYWCPLLLLWENVVIRFDAHQEITFQEFLSGIYDSIGAIATRWEAAWKKPTIKRRCAWARKKELEMRSISNGQTHIDYDYLIKELMQVPNEEIWISELDSTIGKLNG